MTLAGRRHADPPRRGHDGAAEIRSYRPDDAPEVIPLWNAALGEAFPLDHGLFRQNTAADPHFDPDGCWVARLPRGGPAVGFCLAKIAREPLGADGLLVDRGWVSALVVHPTMQRRGLGGRLLLRAEAYLRAQGRRRAVLGGDPSHFFPGIPAAEAALAFFAAQGYRLAGDAYDLRRSLAGYETPPEVHAALAARPGLEIRPLRAGEAPRALAFLDEVFPGRWRYTVGRFFGSGGAIADIVGVVRGSEVLGFAHLFHPGSRWIGPSIAWTRQEAAPAGGLGPMGLSPALRGRGLGLALVDRSVLHLRTLGAQEMVIDWTVLLDFYGRLGFAPWRRYRHGEKFL